MMYLIAFIATDVASIPFVRLQCLAWGDVVTIGDALCCRLVSVSLQQFTRSFFLHQRVVPNSWLLFIFRSYIRPVEVIGLPMGYRNTRQSDRQLTAIKLDFARQILPPFHSSLHKQPAAMERRREDVDALRSTIFEMVCES